MVSGLCFVCALFLRNHFMLCTTGSTLGTRAEYSKEDRVRQKINSFRCDVCAQLILAKPEMRLECQGAEKRNAKRFFERRNF